MNNVQQSRDFLYLVHHDDGLLGLGRDPAAKAFWACEVATVLLRIEQVDPDRVVELLS
jgi:hypothetical protein